MDADYDYLEGKPDEIHVILDEELVTADYVGKLVTKE